jgi:hypothetical protein
MAVRRVVLAALAAVVAMGAAIPVAAAADAPPVSGGTLVEQCQANVNPVPEVGPRACRTGQSVVWGTAAACRTPLRAAPAADAPEQCAVIDGRPVSEARVAAYEGSWVHRALSLQRGLDEAAPLFEEQLPHTHNTFNSSAYQIPTDGSLPSYYPTLTNQDPNQPYSITDQLRMDVRAIEIDLHWVPSPFGSPSTGGFWVTMCHGSGEDPTATGTYVHVGCTYDRPFQDGMAEVARWLKANPDQFLLLYLENQLNGNQQAHDLASQIISQQLGSLVYRPPKRTPCAPMPLSASRVTMRSAGARVLIVGNCGPGAWGTWVHERGPKWDESGNPSNYDATACAKDRSARQRHTSFRRYFEDSTWLTAMLGGGEHLSTDTVAAMVGCGVNIIGMDQLTPDDPRLAALVWSWAQDEPRGGSCAFQGSDARFDAGGCSQRHHFACMSAGGWAVTKASGSWDQGFQACAAEFTGASFAVPPNGYRNALLAGAKPPGVGEVWLNYRALRSVWKPDLASPTG